MPWSALCPATSEPKVHKRRPPRFWIHPTERCWQTEPLIQTMMRLTQLLGSPTPLLCLQSKPLRKPAAAASAGVGGFTARAGRISRLAPPPSQDVLIEFAGQRLILTLDA